MQQGIDIGMEPNDVAEGTEQFPVFRTDDDAAPCRNNHGSVFRSCQNAPEKACFQAPEIIFPLTCKDLRDRRVLIFLNNGIRIEERKIHGTVEFPSDRCLATPHQSNQDDVERCRGVGGGGLHLT